MDRKFQSTNTKYSSDPDLTEINKVRKRKQNPDVQEFAAFRDDVTKMFEQLKSDQEKKFNIITESIQEIKNYRKDVTEINKKIEKILENTTNVYTELKKSVDQTILEHKEALIKIDRLELQLEQVQRQQLANTIEIVNIPKEDKENLQDIVSKLHNSLGVNLTEREINQIYRVSTNKKNPIVVQYHTVKCQNEVIQAMKQYKNIKPNTFTAKIINNDWNEDSIYVNEALTPNARRLHFLARRLCKNQNFKFCWTNKGRVYVRKTEGSPAILIKHEHQIQKLMADYTTDHNSKTAELK